MAFEFKLPEIGEGVTEGEIVKWLVKEGGAIQEDQPLVEIMTDKATVEIPSPREGKVLKLYANEGDVVPVGKVLLSLEESGKPKEVAKATTETTTPAKPEPKKTPPPSAPPSTPSPAIRASTGTPTNQILASPATRRLAREMGLDLSAIPGTGPSGRVTKEDVISYDEGATKAGSPQPAPQPRPATTPVKRSASEFGRRTGPIPSGGEERIPLRGVRKKISEAMARSKRTAAHFSIFEEVDMSEVMALRNKAKEKAESRGVKLTYLPFVVRAIAAALKEFPALNAMLDEEKSEIVRKYDYNIGIAVATFEEELVVPVIRNADRKSMFQLAEEIQQLAEKARQGKLTLEELRGGTFTLTSTGNLGGYAATPIINFPEVAIMGFYRIQEKPVVRNGEIVIRPIANLSLSVDHRVVDGAVGASFIKQVVAYLEDPRLLLLEA